MKLTDSHFEPQTLRERHKSKTRENILQAVSKRLEHDGLAQLSFAEIAREADIGESTIYRYFPNKDVLLEAFWAWAPSAINRDKYPATFEELAARLVGDFRMFDKKEPLIRGMLASPLGRSSRMQSSKERQAAFRQLVANEVGDLPEEELIKLSAAIQLLYSATTWATFKDYWNMNGEAAAQAAITSIDMLLQGARHNASKTACNSTASPATTAKRSNKK